MRYALLLKPHANIRYDKSLQKLAIAELACVLTAWGIESLPTVEKIGGGSFLCFEAEKELASEVWKAVSAHSAVCFAAARQDAYLLPLELDRTPYLERDLAEVLKYKGKTNVDFTAMMLHCAQAVSDFAASKQPLSVLDPLCGRGTTLYCAAQEGHNTVGVEIDAKALKEADQYFVRYLKYHGLKHRREALSLTLAKGRNARETRVSFADTAEHYKLNDQRVLRLIEGDTRRVDALLGKQSCHLLIADLPYGVQHAPREGVGVSSPERLVREAMPAFAAVLKKGGAMALSFNTYTISAPDVARAMEDAGLQPLTQPPLRHLEHWVEQAVNRDVAFAKKNE